MKSVLFILPVLSLTEVSVSIVLRWPSLQADLATSALA